MALNETLRLPDLLAPIPGDSPVGPDLKYSNEFSEIEWAHNQGQDAIPPTKPPGFPGAEAEEHFGRVVELATDFLTQQSKDMRIASFLASALLRVGVGDLDEPAAARCFAGFGLGLQLLHGFVEKFWDDLHASVASRGAILGILGSDSITIPVRLVPLTEWGHTLFHHKDWASNAAADMKAPPDQDTLWAGNFEEGLADTDREYYEQLSEQVGGCVEALEALDASCKEKFREAGEPAPRLSDLRQALQQVSAAATQLLEKKAPPPPPPEPEPPAEPEASQPPAVAAAAPSEEPPPAQTAGAQPASPAPAAESAATTGQAPPAESGAAQPASAPTQAPAPPPQSPPPPPPPSGPQQAVAQVVAAAKALLEQDSASPVPYLLVRGLRWGEIRAGGEGIDPQLLEAPTSEERKRLRTLFLDEQWEELLTASESVMATEAGRGWLDLQRYSILAAEKLGKDYRQIFLSLRSTLRTLLADLPALAEATLMDDSASASAETRAWLQAAGLLQQDPTQEDSSDTAEDTDPDQARREGSFERAGRLVQAGDAEGAIRLLMRRAAAERSERARFITKAEAAAIMLSEGDAAVARPILDELLKEVDEHKLEDWEAGEVVARPLGLLFQCLDAGEGPIRQQIYQRICRLDPLLARSIGEDSNG